MKAPYDIPILILVFNRPTKVETMINALRPLKPQKLYISGDGARSHKEGEDLKVAAVRKVLEKIDWDCEIQTFFRTENLGCRMAVSSGIDWFFEHEKWGIILEDDSIPTEAFFDFTKVLLKRYEHDLDILQICGHNILPKMEDKAAEYIFTRLPFSVGWATWANRWKAFDVHMSDFPDFLKTEKATSFLPDKAACEYLLRKWQQTYDKDNNSWAYAWVFYGILTDKISILSTKKLILNIGFDEEATHTTRYKEERSTEEAAFDIKKMAVIPPKKIDEKQEMQIFYEKYKKPHLLFIRRILPVNWIETLGRWIGINYGLNKK